MQNCETALWSYAAAWLNIHMLELFIYLFFAFWHTLLKKKDTFPNLTAAQQWIQK